MLSYNQIIKILKEFRTAHKQLKNFGNGERWQVTDHDQQATFKYPLMFVEDAQMSASEREYTYGFRIWFVTRVEAPTDRGTQDLYNEYAKAKSDMLSIARDLVAYFIQDNNYPTLQISENANFQTFIENTPDRLTGCYADVQFSVPFDYDNCILPMDGVPTPPTSEVNVTVNNSAYFTLSCGEDGNVVVKNTNGVLVGSKVGTEWIVPAGGGSIDIDINGQPFLTGQSTNVDINVHNSVGADVGGAVGGDWEIGDNTNDFQGNPIEPTPSGQNKHFEVIDSDDNIIGSIEVDTANAAVIRVSNSTVSNSDDSYTASVLAEGSLELPDITVTDSDGSSGAYPSAKNVTCTPMFPSSKLWKTGQTTSYAANDDGDLERGNGASFTTLSKNNYFGNTNRFTDVLGGQTYADDWVIDWSTWDKETGEFIMWYRVKQTGKTWANTISGQPYNLGGYNDCYVPNINELRSLYNFELTSAMNYAPINISASGGSANNLWTSTTVPTATTNALAFNDVVVEQSRAKTLVVQYIVLRIGNVSEL